MMIGEDLLKETEEMGKWYSEKEHLSKLCLKRMEMPL